MRSKFLTACSAVLIACGGHPDRPDPALQTRGAAVMGVDQYQSTHVFDDLPDGGSITYTSDTGADTDVAAIRAHLKSIAEAFAAGDFSAPAAIHARTVPGTETMRAKRAAIHYQYSDVPRGGVVKIRTGDAEALRAIHEFLAFQRSDHHAAGQHAH